MNEIKDKIQFGLEKLSIDTRDYSHHKNLGTIKTPDLPTKDFTIYDSFSYTIQWGDTMSSLSKRFGYSVNEILSLNPKIINSNKIYVGQVIIIPPRKNILLNQIELDFCTGFTTAEIQNAIWGIQCDPFYQFAKIKQIRGEYKEWGANLRDAMKSAIKFGSLPSANSPYIHEGSRNDKNREFLANWANWPIGLDSMALKQKDLSFFAIDGPNDHFDNIRSALWLHMQERRGVSFGLFWHREWTEARGGIISRLMPQSFDGGGHNMMIVGQKAINGDIHLVFQQSWGPNAGDNGFYYFPRIIVNQLFNMGYGAFTLSNRDKTGMTGASVLSSIIGIINNLLGKIK